MTAEIGLMNGIGVALAADSAVTLGGGEGKIYTSADKLFQLSKVAPVGFMIYGSTSLVGIPWETIIKTYRKELGSKCYNTLAEYGTAFIKYIRQNANIFSHSQQIREAKALINVLLLNLRDDIYKYLKQQNVKGSKITDEDIRKTTTEVINKTMELVQKQEKVRGLHKNIRELMRKSLGSSIISMQKDIFKKLPIMPSAKRKLTKMCLEVLVRACFSPLHSGIVVAGFGEKEYRPSLLEIDIDGMIENRPRYVVRKKHTINETTVSAVIPFAQKDVVYTFMEGIDPGLQNMIHSSTSLLFYGVVESIINEIKKSNGKFVKKLEKQIKGGIKKLIPDLFETWKQQRHKVHWGPITEIVSSLPKDELAAMAESLVNLTKFRRRVSTEKETVGGPIDVAVITKGDGFIWVKRKHYFDPKLNPRAIGRYMKEV